MALENELFVREEWEGGDRSGVGRYYKHVHCGGIELKLDDFSKIKFASCK